MSKDRPRRCSTSAIGIDFGYFCGERYPTQQDTQGRGNILRELKLSGQHLLCRHGEGTVKQTEQIPEFLGQNTCEGRSLSNFRGNGTIFCYSNSQRSAACYTEQRTQCVCFLDMQASWMCAVALDVIRLALMSVILCTWIPQGCQTRVRPGHKGVQRNGKFGRGSG